tara:strand:- start:236 stop:424 length:189 start_codon:yes stop_codon:yes gene_type:complete
MTFQTNDKVEMNVNDYFADMFAEEIAERGIGRVIEVTPYKVHVLWSNGQELAHDAERIKAAA